MKNTPIFIVWDRDKFGVNDKNVQDNYMEAINHFYSAYDNDYDMNGLLVLSYPCVESYIISNFKKNSHSDYIISSRECKKQCKGLFSNISDINEETLLLAAENMNKGLKSFDIFSYDPTDLKRVNEKVFRKEEEIYKESKNIKSLSLISMILIDLQIIVEKD